MSQNTPGNPRQYVGENRTLIPFVTRNRRPTSADYRQPETGNYYIYGSVWQVGANPTTGTYGELWMLSKIVANQAYWIQIQANVDIPLTFTTNVGGPVSADSNDNIFMNASTSTYTDGATANTIKTEVQGTNHALFVGRGASTPATTIAVGTTGQTLIGATGGDPVFAAIGTNSGLTNHGVVIAQGNGAFVASSAVSTNALLMGTTGSDPNWTTSGTPYVAGISFDSGANVLSRYNNITSFTPVIAGSTSAGTATYSSQYGRYSRIGNIVFVQVNLEWTGHTGTGFMLVTGMPFIFAAAASFYPMATMIQNVVLPAGALNVVVDGVNATTQMEVACSRDNLPLAQVSMDAAGSLFFMGAYLTDP